ncbi:ras-like GTPase Ras2 [Myxozyma melibiosi]|uniref:Ras-like GTPase Ras2 n=1 Tax=Myxozyma melibiosi TaxID=54550 RepID=A0ABR1F4N1_9ASCO
MALSPRKENAGVKVAVLGDAGVGKTALVIQLCLNHFLERYDPTIEDSYHKHMIINHQPYSLEVLDTGGLEEYSPLREQWIRDCEAFILVYAVTSRASFSKIAPLLAAIERQKGERVPAIVVGNKSDSVGERQVSSAEGSQLAKQIGCEFFESSARNDINITRAFTQILKIATQTRAAKSAAAAAAAAGGSGTTNNNSNGSSINLAPRDLSKVVGGSAVSAGSKRGGGAGKTGKLKKSSDEKCIVM